MLFSQNAETCSCFIDEIFPLILPEDTYEITEFIYWSVPQILAQSS